ncbi:hypothetical protein ACXDF8_01125 [Mycolicibacterium sp. CBM1]
MVTAQSACRWHRGIPVGGRPHPSYRGSPDFGVATNREIASDTDEFAATLAPALAELETAAGQPPFCAIPQQVAE